MSSITMNGNGQTMITTDLDREVGVRWSAAHTSGVAIRVSDTNDHRTISAALSRRQALALAEGILAALGEENDLDEYVDPWFEAGDVVQDDSGQIGVVTSTSPSPSATWVLWRRTGFGTFSAQPALAVGRLRLVAAQGVPDPSTPTRPYADWST